MTQQQVNLKELTTQDLKALAYDTIRQIEQFKMQLNVLNGEIDFRSSNGDAHMMPVPDDKKEAV